MPIGDPNQGVEPVERAHRSGKALRQPVPAPHVLEFVRDRLSQGACVPLRHLHREQYQRPPQPAREGTRAGLVSQHSDVLSEAELGGRA